MAATEEAVTAVCPPRDGGLAMIKLGGSAVTDKAVRHSFRSAEVDAFALEMADQWRNGTLPRCAIVHGAGSFGHFEARQYGVKHGWTGGGEESGGTGSGTGSGTGGGIDHSVLNRGVALTRAAVVSLNGLVVGALVKAGIPAVGLSPWTIAETVAGVLGGTSGAAVVAAVDRALGLGMVPVIHGDVVADTVQGFAILSGDTLVEVLASGLEATTTVTFLSDVDGVYDRPPGASDSPSARLLTTVSVLLDPGDGESGNGVEGGGGDGGMPCFSLDFGLGDDGGAWDAKTADHDVTGGIEAKVDAAARVAIASRSRGVRVTIGSMTSGAVWAWMRGDDSDLHLCTRVVMASTDPQTDA